jgi:hypothetical protein
MNRSGVPLRTRMRSPSFRAKNFSTCTRSPTARGSPMQAATSWADVAFSSAERDRHLESRPVSQLNTWPVVAPVNASRRPSRDATHHSGSGWLARPSPWGTCTSYSLPANWRTPLRVNRVVVAGWRRVRSTPNSRPTGAPYRLSGWAKSGYSGKSEFKRAARSALRARADHERFI